MSYTFSCSLCHNGILGGWLIIDSDSITYKTGKVTVDKKYRNLVIPFEDIDDISWKKVIFPVVAFSMQDGEQYKFLIFNKKRFIKVLNEVKEQKS